VRRSFDRRCAGRPEPADVARMRAGLEGQLAARDEAVRLLRESCAAWRARAERDAARACDADAAEARLEEVEGEREALRAEAGAAKARVVALEARVAELDAEADERTDAENRARRRLAADLERAKEEELGAIHTRVREVVGKKSALIDSLRARLAAAQARATEAEAYLHSINQNLQKSGDDF